MTTKILWILLISTFSIAAMTAPLKTEKLKWGNLDVTYVEDNRLPLYGIRFYFADGAASDISSRAGETKMTFDLLTSGTRRFNQKEISDNLEFYGASFGFNVTHEYVVGGVSGLVKDIIPTMKQVCHLFKDSNYPVVEIRKSKKLRIDALKSMINSHDSIADRAFREISMDGSEVALPVAGKVKTISKITQKSLINKLSYFKSNVKKRLYLSGPRDILKIEEIVRHECGFDFTKSQTVRNIAPIKLRKKQKIVLVTVPKANQSQVRLGRILDKNEIKNIPLLMLSSKFLGGGFTSQLMKSVRVESGLSYSVGAFAAGQRGYGRSGISSFTKNETIVDLIETIRTTVDGVGKHQFSNEEFEASRGYLLGSYPFNFESPQGFVDNLIQLDHAGIPWDEFYELPNRVEKIKTKEVAKKISELFPWDKQAIVILGPRSLAKKLKTRYKNLEIINWKKFL
jgi:zinc protease